MKRIVRPLLLMLALSALVCVSAFAADEAGLYGAVQTDDYAGTVSFRYCKADGTQVTAPTPVGALNVYNEAVKLGVSYTAATPSKQYVILVTNTELTSGAAITDATAEYIDQTAAGENGVNFTVYQKEFDVSKTYYVYLSSDDAAGVQGRTLIGTYHWYEAVPAKLTLSLNELSETTGIGKALGETASLCPGQYFVVTVGTDAPVLNAVTALVSYDKDLVEFQSGYSLKVNTAIGNITLFSSGWSIVNTIGDSEWKAFTTESLEKGVKIAGAYSDQSEPNLVSDAENGGSLIHLVFKVREGLEDQLNARLIGFTATEDTILSYVGADGKTYPYALDTSASVVRDIRNYILGDANGDEKIDVLDAVRILDHVVERSRLTGNRFLAADVASEKGKVDVLDAVRILDYVVERISAFE